MSMLHTHILGRVHALPALASFYCVLLLNAGGFAASAATPDVMPPPSELRAGEEKFRANCARCHGERAGGTKQGPPLVHKIYEPNHHGDLAFQRAAAGGVRAHHWNFGDMPRIEGVTSEDVTQITRYIRWLQRQAGIM
jgi:mono/diheme cytochrome c family protein